VLGVGVVVLDFVLGSKLMVLKQSMLSGTKTFDNYERMDASSLRSIAAYGETL